MGAELNGFHPETDYTTEDEVAYLRSLKKEGKMATLTNYAAAFHRRKYLGEGMKVNKREVAKELRVLLGPDVFRREMGRRDGEITQMAVEWLQGGNLRAAAKRHEREDEEW